MKRVLISLTVAGVIAIISIVGLLCLDMWMHKDHHPSSEFKTSALALRLDRDYWLSHGRQLSFSPSQVAGTPKEFFVFTNLIYTTNAVFHCRFGVSRPGWPPGVLAITDD